VATAPRSSSSEHLETLRRAPSAGRGAQVASSDVAGPTRQSSKPARTSTRPPAGGLDASTAVATFLVAWVLAQFASFAVLAAFGEAGEPIAVISMTAFTAGLLSTWTVYVGSMWVSSRQSGTGDFRADFAVEFRPVDTLGLVIGFVSQFGLLWVVYRPLQALWPDTFDDDEVRESAQDLFDRVSGGWLVVMILLVVVGAPLAEELFYRGLLQHSLASRYHRIVVLVGVALVFALIHFRPVEYPGLFAFGLVLGACLMVTGRLGMSIAAHVGFNMSALLVVL
jgi:membrane protease YdiL (CAAX protease family)